MEDIKFFAWYQREDARLFFTGKCVYIHIRLRFIFCVSIKKKISFLNDIFLNFCFNSTKLITQKNIVGSKENSVYTHKESSEGTSWIHFYVVRSILHILHASLHLNSAFWRIALFDSPEMIILDQCCLTNVDIDIFSCRHALEARKESFWSLQ